jgi:hypothetical protein
MKKVFDVLQAIISILSGAVPLLEAKVNVLPVNPLIRQDLLTGTAITATIAGIGAWATTKYFKRTPALGWSALAGLILALAFIYLLASAGITFGLSPAAQAGAVRIAYLVVFVCIGIAVGGFLGLIS